MRASTMEPVSGNTRLIVAGMGDCVASSEGGRSLATFALGSCVGISAYDPQSGCGALLHFMLPDSRLNPQKAAAQPAAFCDTGLPWMLHQLKTLGADTRRLRICMAGAAKVIEGSDFFDIGRRNQLAARRKLWELGLILDDEDTGGERSRTLKLDLGSGQVTVRHSFGERSLGGRIQRGY